MHLFWQDFYGILRTEHCFMLCCKMSEEGTWVCGSCNTTICSKHTHTDTQKTLNYIKLYKDLQHKVHILFGFIGVLCLIEKMHTCTTTDGVSHRCTRARWFQLCQRQTVWSQTWQDLVRLRHFDQLDFERQGFDSTWPSGITMLHTLGLRNNICASMCYIRFS